MFRIGDFSRLARVTIRTLHHYDEAGLLHPAHLDERTGYRYYTAAQLEVLQRILLLRDLGFSLDEIRDVLEMRPNGLEFVRLLDARRAQLIETISGDQSRLRRLEALRDAVAGAASPDVPAVVLRDIAAIQAHTVRARVPRLGEPVQTLFESAEAAVARARARADSSPFIIFHDLEYRCEDADIEVCIPVKGTADARISTRLIPAAPSVGCVTYHGPYAKALALYDVMLLWMERSGFRMDGPLREVYHRYGADQIGYRLPSHVLADSSVDYVTELQAPVAPVS
jgi:DNA-binding transcriptional MerR regulator